MTSAQNPLLRESAHVRQQTGGAVSMLPQAGELEIDPDPRLEREAEETAQRVMQGGKIGVHRMEHSDVHVQRMPAEADDGMLYGAVEDLQQQVSEHEESIEKHDANLDDHEASIDNIEDRQEQMMGTLLEASPGAPEDFDWQGASMKGATGVSVGLGIGAMTGSPEAAGAAAFVGGVTSIAKTVSKEFVGTVINNRPGGEADKLEQMYHEMAEMYQEFIEARLGTGSGDRPESVPSPEEVKS